MAEGAYHPSLHTNAYYNEINKQQLKATSKEDVLSILDNILPLENSDDNFYAINNITVLDCIDYKKSKLSGFVFKLVWDSEETVMYLGT